MFRWFEVRLLAAATFAFTCLLAAAAAAFPACGVVARPTPFLHAVGHPSAVFAGKVGMIVVCPVLEPQLRELLARARRLVEEYGGAYIGGLLWRLIGNGPGNL